MANIYSLLALLIWVCCAPVNEGTLCLFCESGVQDYSACTKVAQCTGDQVCSTEKYIEVDGTVRWYSGCQHREVCNRLGLLSKRFLPDEDIDGLDKEEIAQFGDRFRRLVRPGRNVCSGCCDDSDYCNAKECGFNADFVSAGFKTCYKCDDVKSPTKCDYLTQCTDQETCFTELIHQGGTTTGYRLGCEEKKMCEAYEGFIQYFTKRRAVSIGPPGSASSSNGDLAPPLAAPPREGGAVETYTKDHQRTRRVIDDPRALCLTCCNDDFCNRLQDCGFVHTSTSITPTPVISATTTGQPVLGSQIPTTSQAQASSVFQGMSSYPLIQPSFSPTATPTAYSVPSSPASQTQSMQTLPSSYLPVDSSIQFFPSSLSSSPNSLQTLPSPSSSSLSTPSLLYPMPPVSQTGSTSLGLSISPTASILPVQSASPTTSMSPTASILSVQSASQTTSISPTSSSSYSMAPSPSTTITPPPTIQTSQVIAVISNSPGSGTTSNSSSISGQTSTIAPPPNKVIEGVWCFNCFGNLCGLPGFQSAVKCDRATPFCLNTYLAESGIPSITKSCTDFATCKSKWYDTSSDNSNCDSLNVRPGQRKECNYCCVKDYCNNQTIPKLDTLFDPVMFPGFSRRDIGLEGNIDTENIVFDISDEGL